MGRELFGVFESRERFERIRSLPSSIGVGGETITVGVRDFALGLRSELHVRRPGRTLCHLG